jgi:uncharacterized protein YecE (DUF72 family)
MTDQLALFDTAPPPPPDPVAAQLAAMYADAGRLASALPATVRFGTSSWSFPGWKGLVYSSRRSQTALSREGLREYARHPLLSIVGVDRSYYAPILVDDLRSYASQLPDGFECCFKAPAAVMAQRLGPPSQSSPNPDFLSVDRLIDDLLAPLALACYDRTGPIILEMAPVASAHRLSPDALLERLDAFLTALPREFRYAVELRDARLLTPAYRALLQRTGVAHTYNYWSAMPMPARQAEIIPPEDHAFGIVRLLLRPGTFYEAQRERFSPFDALVEPDEAMRRDVVSVVQQLARGGRTSYVLVNNKAEGSSPLTVMALARAIADATAADQTSART